MSGTHTVAAIATPQGSGGLAAIRLSGTNAYPIAARVFYPAKPGKRVEEAKGYTAMFGHFCFRGQKVDEGVALFYRAPHSYTGENVVELFCHGGTEVSREVLQACIEAGAQPAAPGEFTKRAVLSGRISLTQAEAVMDMISATSRQGVRAAQAALDGSLFEEIQAQKEKLTHLAGHLAAYIDFPEEDVETLTLPHFIATLHEVGLALTRLIEGYGKGALLRNGVSTVIIGSPNVGKSTLFNLLSGFDRAIVTPVAGTTRDVLREEVRLEGVTLLLSDTAGLHNTEDVVEAEGIRRSYNEIDKADLVIAVFDGSLPLGQGELDLAKKCKGRPTLAVINKSDLGLCVQAEELQPFAKEVLVVSAKASQTRQSLEQAVLKVLQLEQLQPGMAMLANERQLAAVVTARDALAEAEQVLEMGVTFDAAGVLLDDALVSLTALTGENASDQIIEDVFSRFCVGK